MADDPKVGPARHWRKQGHRAGAGLTSRHPGGQQELTTKSERAGRLRRSAVPGTGGGGRKPQRPIRMVGQRIHTGQMFPFFQKGG